MIKGCTKKMILLKDTGSEFFEEAYFILKPDTPFAALRSERDFVAEANRIVAESRPESRADGLSASARKSARKSVRKPRTGRKSAFFLGILSGILLCVLSYIIIRAMM